MFKNAKGQKAAYRREFSIEEASGPSAVRNILSRCKKRLERFDLSAETLGDFEMVVAEALNNVVEHAYPDQSGPIRVHIEMKSGDLSIDITDQGLGMPDGKAPDGTAQSVNVDLMALPEGGFGWFLIRNQAHNVEYVRSAWENHLKFSIKCK